MVAEGDEVGLAEQNNTPVTTITKQHDTA